MCGNYLKLLNYSLLCSFTNEAGNAIVIFFMFSPSICPSAWNNSALVTYLAENYYYYYYYLFITCNCMDTR